ncbi:hypothetical protein J31TS6_62310 [Brevibacillus reuszeri]|nr:hypothetical protein J31TS6_62310 [Brevibacillus reuszeri]
MKWGEYSFFAYSPNNDDYKLLVICFDSNSTEVRSWIIPGYRYAKDIKIDYQNQKVNFIMKQKDDKDEAFGPFPVSFEFTEFQND